MPTFASSKPAETLRGAKLRNDLVICGYTPVCGSGLVACTLSVNPMFVTKVKPAAAAVVYWKQTAAVPPTTVDSSVRLALSALMPGRMVVTDRVKVPGDPEKQAVTSQPMEIQVTAQAVSR